MINKLKLQRGVSLLELVIFMSITLFLFGFVTINLVRFQQKTSINSILDTFASDMKSQQAKAMSGDGNTNQENFGIYFLSDKYILFKGSSYSPSNPTNFSVNLEGGMNFQDVLLPSNTLIFLHKSGEVNGFSQGHDSFSLQDSQGQEIKTVLINKYGVITQIN